MNGLINGWLIERPVFFFSKKKEKNNPKTKCKVAKCKQILPQNRTGRKGYFLNIESVSKSGLQKVRTSTTVQPESISRKDMRIRYLLHLLTDLLKDWQTDRYKVQSLN